MGSPCYLFYICSLIWLSFSLILSSLRATDLWWTQNWTSTDNLGSSSNVLGKKPAAATGASDTTFFNTSTLKAIVSANLTAALSIAGLVFSSTGTSKINPDGSPNQRSLCARAV